MKGLAADLHVHTNASDGALRPAEVVARAKAAGLTAVGITDHDTVSGLAEALQAGRDLGIEVVPGIEFSTDTTGREIHILSYHCEFTRGPLVAILERLERGRLERAEEIMRRLRAVGVAVSPERVRAEAGGRIIGRVHIARALVAQGLAPGVSEAFQLYLVRGRPGYVPRFKLHPLQAVRLVAEAGEPAEDQTGVVACVGGRPIALDLFDRPSTLARIWPRLVRGYALDALGAEAAPVDEEAVRGFLGEVARGQATAHDAVGLGTEVVLTGAGLTGDALVWEDAVVQLAAFPSEPPRGGGRRGARHAETEAPIAPPSHRAGRRRRADGPGCGR